MNLKTIVLSMLLLGYATEVHSQHFTKEVNHFADSLVMLAKATVKDGLPYTDSDFNRDLNLIRSFAKARNGAVPSEQIHSLKEIELDGSEKGGLGFFLGFLGLLFLFCLFDRSKRSDLPSVGEVIARKIAKKIGNIKIKIELPYHIFHLPVFSKESGLEFAYFSRPPTRSVDVLEHVPWFC